MSRNVDLIVVHCSATNPHQLIGAQEIRDWHTLPKANPETNMYRYLGRNYTLHDLPEDVQGRSGRGWRDIGYNNVICRSGILQHGRDLAIAGAHAKGYNQNSVGICMVGGVDIYGNAENNFNDKQFKTLRGYIDTLLDLFPGSKVVGHRDLSVDLNEDGVITPDEYMKQCPSFDVKDWYYD
ncbi:MAG: N-acetylmuramoyl-L-alanine amidase [Gammaproteobacteria bacterium]|nr:N-acetylmuramoyl-L-alanine amidase [Gammaproteobacteria bacterium]